jgi:hypothetical protein
VNGKTLLTCTAAVVTGLVNAKTYYFTVKAVNLIGSSPTSIEVFAIPAAPVPAAPTHIAATVSNASSAVTWEAPSSAGGSNITSYSVTAADSTLASRGAESCGWNSGALTCAVLGITNGDS